MALEKALYRSLRRSRKIASSILKRYHKNGRTTNFISHKIFLNELQPVFAKLKISLILCHVRYLRNILSLSLYHGKILEKCRKINAPLVSIFPTPVLLSPDLEKKVMQLLIFVLQFATFFVKTT